MNTSYFSCPTCGLETKKLITHPAVAGIHCPKCYDTDYADVTKTARHWSIHDTVVNDGTTKVTQGKRWEIEHRVLDRESGKMINSVTGKPAQF